MKKYKLHFSTCPNDTFMFDALVNNRIDTMGFDFEVALSDIEELNEASLRGEADITKISYAIYPKIEQNYELLRSGSALGYGNGPLLVSSKNIDREKLSNCHIALPGENTTAASLLSILFPDIKSKSYYIFSEISDAILSGEVDAGVLIHEERFSYQERGLRLIADLGEEWNKRFSLPIPLGAIAARRDIGDENITKINLLIRNSIEYAMNNPLMSRDYIKKYAQNLSDEVIDRHIAMFVNQFSLDIGDIGEQAIKELFCTK